MSDRIVSFDELTIARLFGNEAAENEEISRLKEYYFKNETYTQIAANLPLRILVGHKGIGKSALFSVAQQDDMDKNIIVISIKPDDIVDLHSGAQDFLSTIRNWKDGLSEIIAKKVLNSFSLNKKDLGALLKKSGGQLLDFLDSTFRNYVNEAKIDLSPAKEKLVQQYLKNNTINVYIDDLDRGWQGRESDITQLSALLNAVRDLSKENKGLNFKVSLRSDVYYLYRTSDESTDKIEGSVIWLTWTQHEILVMLAKRIETFFGRCVDENKIRNADISRYLDPVFERTFQGEGHWKNELLYKVIMSLNRKRPRDLVKLCTLAARFAHEMGVSKIGTDNLRAVFKQYSQGRLQDTINEYRSELPSIERLLLNMKPNREQRRNKLHKEYLYTTSELLKKISNIEQGGVFRFKSGAVASTKELAAFMYKINFLVARKPGKTERQFFEEDWYLLNQFADFGYHWEIHPAFRWALPTETIEDLYYQI